MEGWQNWQCTGLENRRPHGLQGSSPWPSDKKVMINYIEFIGQISDVSLHHSYWQS